MDQRKLATTWVENLGFVPIYEVAAFLQARTTPALRPRRLVNMADPQQ